MNQTQMLHQMCQEVLAEADIRAICKNRGLPQQAATSRPLLESLFLSETGVVNALGTLDRTEIALLHLLKGQDKPVDVAFFSLLNPPKGGAWGYGTFTQRYQGVFSKVKDRLVRKGLLLLALEPESFQKKTNMERWLFALPVQFARHLPPLLESTQRLSGEGDWQKDVAREKLKTAVAHGADGENKNDGLEIVHGELCWGGQPFRANRVAEWQKRSWQAETASKKLRKEVGQYALPPAEAVLRILADLDAEVWSTAEALATPLEIFGGGQVDAGEVCASGWRWGLLARQQAEGRMWYRLAPTAADAEVPPKQYFTVQGEELVVDLDTVPFTALETLVLLSEQRPVPGKRPLLQVTPNLLKLGRMTDSVAELPLTDWLQKNAPTFQQAFETVQQRRGKTILHDNLSVARVSDLSLKVALEKALGNRIVALGDEFLAFPHAALEEVQRLVIKMGHVVKAVDPS